MLRIALRIAIRFTSGIYRFRRPSRSNELELYPLEKAPQFVAGADLSFEIGSNTVYEGIVVMTFPELETVEERGLKTTAPFPYVPGLLSFRAAPAILKAFAMLENRPDVLVTDGQGTAHPRGFGIACHLGFTTCKARFRCCCAATAASKRIRLASSVVGTRHAVSLRRLCQPDSP